MPTLLRYKQVRHQPRVLQLAANRMAMLWRVQIEALEQHILSHSLRTQRWLPHILKFQQELIHSLLLPILLTAIDPLFGLRYLGCMHDNPLPWLKELRNGASIHENRERLMSYLQKNPRRRLYVRMLLSLAKISSGEQSASYAESAADMLFGILQKPKLALIVYRYAAEKRGQAEQLVEAIQSLESAVSKPAVVQEQEKDKAFEMLISAMQQALETGDEVVRSELRLQATQGLLLNRPSVKVIEERLQILAPWLRIDDTLRDELLSALRSRERHDAMVVVLEHCLKQEKSHEQRRNLLLQLGHTWRFGLSDLLKAADCFEQLVEEDPNDRLAWGELLECLEDAEEEERLAKALEKRIQVTTGLEQRELFRQLKVLNQRLGREHVSWGGQNILPSA